MVGLNGNPTTVGVFHASFLRLLGGNFILNDGGGIAVQADHLADFRQQFSLDTIVGSPAIDIFNLATAELRGEYKVTGQVRVGNNSTLRLSIRSRRVGVDPPVGEINGQIRVRGDSSVSFSLFTLKDGTEFGSVTVNGTLNCGGKQGAISVGGGQTIEDIFPNPDDRANSQCNTFNGNLVLPAP